jgi:tetratricopeptide (TPR) repeat protein
MRVNMQLVRVADGATLWTDSFDGQLTDLFALQDSMSSRVSHAMALKLLSHETQRIEKRHTNNAEAYEAYLKGRYFWNKSTEESIRKAIDYFEEATRIDPNFGVAYAGLAHCYNSLGSSGAVLGPLLPSQVYPKARAAALRALEIDEQIGEAYASLAHVKWNRKDGRGQHRHKASAGTRSRFSRRQHQRGLGLLLGTATRRSDRTVPEGVGA